MSTKKLDADKGEPTVIIGARRECCQTWVLECKDGPSSWQAGEQSREMRLLSGGLIRWASGSQAVRQPGSQLASSASAVTWQNINGVPAPVMTGILV